MDVTCLSSVLGVGKIPFFHHVHSHRASSDEQHALGPLYLCAVTNARRRSLHSVLRLPRHTKQQQQRHRTQRTGNLGGCSPRLPTGGGSVARARPRLVVLLLTLRISRPPFNPQSGCDTPPRMRKESGLAATAAMTPRPFDASSMRSSKLSAHSITRSPTKERAVGYTVASVLGVVGDGSGVSGEW